MSLLLAVVAFLGAAAGFAYAYDPQREVLSIALDSAAPAPPETPLAGTVVEVKGDRLRLDSASGPIEVTVPAATRIEELRSLPLNALTPGTPVNVGIERSDSSTSISGIVAVEPR